jgi:glucose-6-phosphate 1-dehydrogenase
MKSCARHEKTRVKTRMLVHADNTLGAMIVAARVQRAGKEFAGDPRKRRLLDEGAGRQASLEWLLGTATAGEGAFLPRKDAATAVRALVGRGRASCQRARLYQCNSCEPKQAHALIAADSSRRKPISDRG